MIVDRVVGGTLSLLAFVILLQLVSCQDIITTIAGTGTSSYSGDGGGATLATFNYPYGVAVDSTGTMPFVA